MEQFKEELLKHRPYFKHKIQYIGDNHTEFKNDKLITICVYNSVSIIEKYCDSLNQIFVDEAHHINMPKIYETESNLEDYELERNLEDDDTEDEIKNTTGYNKIIKSLIKYNNNVYLSATIDEHQDFEYYKKDIRDMINDKYLCDYNIIVPIFSDDPSNKNICEYLINNYINIIVYCNSQKEGKKINELLNTLEKGCSEYIDCKTRKEKRDKIINKYKNNKIKFLVNVRILVEGFDAPITKGVYFIHLPSSKTTIIQIIGRALRLHPLKTIANIILPFSSDGDEVNINKFLKILASNDSKIKK
jgi:superfamily II DNA or RNA helicase